MKKILLTILLIPVLLLVAYAAILAFLLFTSAESYSWRQKLTLTVETPVGEVSGASISRVSWRKHRIRWDGMGWRYDLTGEAVVVEVTPRRYLFALLGGPEHTEYMGLVAAASIAGRKLPWIDGALFDEVRDKRDRAAGVITVPEDQYPLLVTFADIADPASVKLVDPADLAASFGPGVRLKSVRLEVTDEAVTVGRVEGVLGWLCDHITNYRRLSGKAGAISDNQLSNNLGPGSFVIGECE